MNVIDKVVEFFHPAAAFKREKFRFATEQLRKFEAASRGTRRTANWDARSTSANSEAYFALNTLRDRSRDLFRNNPYAYRAITGLATNIIGSGIRPSWRGTKQTEKKAKGIWKLWAEKTKCDFDGKHTLYGLQLLAVKSMLESGEVIILKRRVSEKNLPIPMQLQVLEADYIDTAKDGLPLSNGGEIIQGIEFDSTGKRVAYWIFDRHPGDGRWHTISKRVPAEDVIHLYTIERPGQIRGIPVGVSAMLRLKDFDEYEDAQLIRQKIAACFSVFVQSDDSATQSGNIDDFERTEPGMIYKTNPGETITFASPPPTEGYDVYTKTILRAVAAGFGVTYEMLTNDLSNVNFSSGRMGWIEFHRIVTRIQELVIIPQMLDNITDWFMEANIIAGNLRQPLDVSWTSPRREMIDPVKETKGMGDMVRNGFASWQDIVRRYGGDPDEVSEELAKDIQMFDQLGIKPECDPRYGVEPKQLAQATNNQE